MPRIEHDHRRRRRRAPGQARRQNRRAASRRRKRGVVAWLDLDRQPGRLRHRRRSASTRRRSGQARLSRSMTTRDLPGASRPNRNALTGAAPREFPAPGRRIDLENDLGQIDDDAVRRAQCVSLRVDRPRQVERQRRPAGFGNELDADRDRPRRLGGRRHRRRAGQSQHGRDGEGFPAPHALSCPVRPQGP